MNEFRVMIELQEVTPKHGVVFTLEQKVFARDLTETSARQLLATIEEHKTAILKTTLTKVIGVINDIDRLLK
ncbi:hypothetical protein LCGC14_0711180 [marine sediment metagenome]|uniref:Uncharacterized protein n=1 Tax=marine sediment metagenome TaxID=412755 RepID=A0A0F9T0K6_9ZZZZ